MTAAALFFSTLLLVMALGAQSLLVNNGRYAGAFFNSFAIGIGNLILFKLAPDAGGWEIAGFLAGGPVGIVLAMYLLRHYHRRGDDAKGWNAKHLKTGNVYRVTGEAINATNAQDGQNMVIYERDGKRFVREAGEFIEKFAAIAKGGA